MRDTILLAQIPNFFGIGKLAGIQAGLAGIGDGTVLESTFSNTYRPVGFDGPQLMWMRLVDFSAVAMTIVNVPHWASLNHPVILKALKRAYAVFLAPATLNKLRKDLEC